MRLGTCVAVEAIVGIAVLGGVGVGGWYGYQAARDYAAGLSPQHAHAATLTAPLITPIDARLGAQRPAPAAAPAPAVAAAVPSPTVPIPTVFPGTDDELLAPLRDAAVTATKLNRGGNTLSIRLDLASGGRAAFKPEQVNATSTPRREVAAYRIDRYLHIGRVAPAIARSFPVADLEAGFDAEHRGWGSQRIRVDGLARDGMLGGSVSWWIPEIVVPKIDGFKVDDTDGVVTWKRLVKVGAVIPDDDLWLVQQISTMTLFDYIIDNIDRWTGGNVRIAPGGNQIFFMDNTFSFTTDGYGHRKGQNYLKRVQVFSRDLVDRLRAMTEDGLRAVLEPDRGPFEAILTDREIRAVLGRRDFAIAYIDSLIARHGDAAVLAFP